MRKFKLLLATMLCIVGIGKGQAQITANSQLSNSKVYTVTTARGAWMVDQSNNRMHYNPDYTSSEQTPTNDVNYQFAFINYEGHYYLYAPAVKKFIQPQKYFVDGYSTPVTLAESDGNVKVNGEFTTLTINIGGSQFTWDTWSNYDDGNIVSIIEAADLSAAELNEAINVLTGTARLDSHKVYTIECERVGQWASSADHNSLSSTLAYPAATDAEKQFAFYHEDGKVYLYSVGAGKFLKADGTFATGSLGDPIDYRIIGTDGYNYMLFIPSLNFYFNSQLNGGYVINNYSTGDAGNKQSFTEVENADVYTQMYEIVHPSYTLTYVIKDEKGNKIFESAPLSTTQGAHITTLPAEYQRAYCTYNNVDVTISEVNTTIEFTATWNGPFEISADYANAHWYDMAMRSTWYVTSAVKDGEGAYKTQNANTMGLVEDSYQWAFIGNPYAGFKIINKAEGDGKSFAWADNQAKDKGIPTIMPDNEGNHNWNIFASSNTSVPAGSFCLNVPGTNLSINQYGGAGGSIKFWNSTGNAGDAGSAFTVFDVPTNFANFVVDEIAPCIEATGYFTLTDAAKASIGYDEAYKTECPFETYKSMKQKLTEAQASTANYILPETGYYILKNKNYGTYMGIDPSDANMYGDYKTAVAAKQIVKLTKTGADTYTISLMGKYAPATVAQSQPVTATTEAGTYIVVPQNGTAAFRANSNEVYSCLHCASKGEIVGWEAAAAASQWEVIDAESIEFTIGAEGYATAYLPFPAEFGGTIPLPEPKGVWTFDDTNDLLAGTGIATLKATTHAKNNVTETDLATAGITTVDGPYDGNGALNIPKGSSLLMSANTNATNIGTYTIMYDVCVEDGSTYVPLLQNSLTDGKDGSLFINKNQVGLGGGFGYHGTIENNKWYRIVFAVQPNGASLYVDGVQLVSNLNLLTPYNEHWKLTTGALFFADEDGEEKAIKTSEVRFWDTVLSADQIADLGSVTGDAPKFPEAVGSWTFDDATDPYATTGTATLSEVGNAAITATDGEVTVPVGAGLELKTNLDNIPNAYTLLLDVKFAAVNGYAAIFQNDVNNSKDASIFVKDGAIGLNSAGLGYKGTINADTWYRIVTVIDNGYCTLYVDGEQVGKSAGKDVNAWTMRETKELLLFTDDSGEEKEVTTSEVRFWNMALTATQIAQLGTVGTTIDDENEKPEYVEPTAYTAVIDGNTHSKWLTLNKLDGIIPTKTAVIIKGTPKTYLYKIAAETAPVDNNDLKGTLEPIEATGKYILAKPQGKEVGFYLAESGKIAAGKAYVELDGNTGPLVKALLFGEEAETAIDNVKANTNTNVNNAAIYNMAGQRISKLQKGVNIVNGKKILK